MASSNNKKTNSHSELCHSVAVGYMCLWWTRQASNLRQSGYEPGALPTELRVQQRKICLHSRHLASEKMTHFFPIRENLPDAVRLRSARVPQPCAPYLSPCDPRTCPLREEVLPSLPLPRCGNVTLRTPLRLLKSVRLLRSPIAPNWCKMVQKKTA